MRTSFIIALLGITVLAASTMVGQEQQQISKVELYGGYDYVRYNAAPRISGVPPSESFNANGASVQIAFNAKRWLGLVGDLSGYAVARHGFATSHQISYLFGPRVNFRIRKVTPFTHVLLGHAWAEDGLVFGSVGAFGMAAGGGVDVSVSRRIAIRPVQAEYLLTKFPDGNTDMQNNFRFGCGIVLRFGTK